MLSTESMSSFCNRFIHAGIVRKKGETRWCKIINSIWNVLTFHTNDDDFMRRASTLCGHIYMSQDWEYSDKTLTHTYVLLKHEAAHLRFFKETGPILGLLIYFLFPLPIGLAYGRYYIERKAIIDELLAIDATGGNTLDRLNVYVRALAGWSYFFAWPFKVSIRSWLTREFLRRKHPAMTFYGRDTFL